MQHEQFIRMSVTLYEIVWFIVVISSKAERNCLKIAKIFENETLHALQFCRSKKTTSLLRHNSDLYSKSIVIAIRSSFSYSLLL